MCCNENAVVNDALLKYGGFEFKLLEREGRERGWRGEVGGERERGWRGEVGGEREEGGERGRGEVPHLVVT